ncbi:MAG: translation initiation factor IF-6 [Candidatus Thermoplasmatota archaeon]|jgi:translation initiation factor 6|nr:translation initiation factor IF-6 [Candidatus Thermoplasmatota archaeon]MCL5800375.1 translation initiation factor IF-6 [Candidatus Thermoplasmatota archaeon]
MIKKIDIDSSDFVGLFARVSDDIAIFSRSFDSKTADDISLFLKVKAIRADLNGINLAGSLVSMNSNGIIMPRESRIESDELGGRNVVYLKDKVNAMGNDILTNDRGAIIHKNFGKSSLKEIQDALDVEVLKSEIGGVKTVGSVSVLTPKGMLVTPTADEEEMKRLSQFFKVPIKQATANFGSIYVGSAMMANSSGVIVGTTTTPIELGRIDEALS